ncbi:MAG: hypothetical protein L3J58_02580 [Emcibacter sp.]|nr:hypothetical protein [Emcibacter sp.]
MDKVFISADDLLVDSFKMAHKILESGFEPDYIVGVWRGGTPIGIAVQEYLDYRGLKSDHIAIRTSSYTGIATRTSTVRVHGLGYIVDNINAEDKLLIVDDVFDSGLSVDAIIRDLSEQCRRNMPEDTRVATVYYKPEKRKTERIPDYYLHETDDWLVFPHELHGLTTDEIAKFKSPELLKLLTKKI